MQISSVFPSKYLKASDLNGKNVRVVIDRVELENIGDDDKPVVYFQRHDKGVVLNKTNANNIALAYGDDTDDWTGKEVILYEAMVDFQGRSMPAIRIRAPSLKDRRPANGAPKAQHRVEQRKGYQVSTMEPVSEAVEIGETDEAVW